MEIESDEEVECPHCGKTFTTKVIIDYEPEHNEAYD